MLCLLPTSVLRGVELWNELLGELKTTPNGPEYRLLNTSINKENLAVETFSSPLCVFLCGFLRAGPFYSHRNDEAGRSSAYGYIVLSCH
jgi:hypothetical protein